MSRIKAKLLPILAVFSVICSSFLIEAAIRVNPVTYCNRIDQTGCLSEQCCVYQILIHTNVKTEKRVNKRTVCKSLKQAGDFCIPGDELFSCPCKNGLSCLREGDQQNFGHCG